MLVVSYTATSIYLQWTPGYDGNSAILGYNVYIREGSSQSFTLIMTNSLIPYSTIEQSINVTNVMPFTRYQFKVAACNTIGCSDDGLSSPITTKQAGSHDIKLIVIHNKYAACSLCIFSYYTMCGIANLKWYFCSCFIVPGSSPRNCLASAYNSTALMLTWLPPLVTNGIITTYRVAYVPLRSLSGIEYSSNSMLQGTVFTTNNATDIIINDLLKATEYSITIAAYTSVGPGPFSSTPCQAYTHQDSKIRVHIDKEHFYLYI